MAVNRKRKFLALFFSLLRWLGGGRTFEGMASKRTTRPPAVAPPGHVTLVEAAEILDVSYSTVYRHHELTEFQQDASGVITIPRKELGKIREALRQPASGERKAITLRVDAEDYERWERTIARTREEPVSVPRWLTELAGAAAKRAGV